jgi:hypothetical protein
MFLPKLANLPESTFPAEHHGLHLFAAVPLKGNHKGSKCCRH